MFTVYYMVHNLSRYIERPVVLGWKNWKCQDPAHPASWAFRGELSERVDPQGITLEEGGECWVCLAKRL
jgi:hypothetical protein